ncbi:hypothetical protein [Candidatus Palauibacter sp.]|uniref:hypothetical protein n=1 Tax=Candidatus Palauibacter sp. TaxID=3101350 RepID=UPI003B5C6FBB
MRVRTTSAYRLGLGAALATAFILVWVIGAVGLIGAEGDSADLMYAGVLAVGIVGAIVARLRPRGMARTLLGTALAQASVAVIALITGEHHSPVTSVFEILGSNAVFVALWVGSAFLFRRAAREGHPAAESHGT